MKFGDIKFLIDKKNEPMVIVNDATYELIREGEVVTSGSCDIIEGKILRILFEANEVGSYKLILTYRVGEEIRKPRYYINVS